VALYSIKDLESLSGIKAHTLRIWEQRYSILNPKRTESNIRFYEDSDLKLLLNIALLNKNGIKISKIAKMDNDEIAASVAAISSIGSDNPSQLDALTISMIEMDEYKFDKIISTNIKQLGFERTMFQVLLPFLDKLSLLWLTGSIEPVQESFISNLIRQKIIFAIDNEAFVTGRNVKKFMIYTPPGERQELSILLFHYLLKARSNQVIYLGQDISLMDLKHACRINSPDYLFTMLTESYQDSSINKYIHDLRNLSPDIQVLLSGYQVAAQNIQSEGNVTVLESLLETIEFLDKQADLKRK